MDAAQPKIWCDEDEHSLYANFTDFNEWLESEDAQESRVALGVDSLAQPSKALFASDREAYDQAFLEFRNRRRHEALNQAYFVEQFGNDHWFTRSSDHFLQLIELMSHSAVVPFVGAGISVAGGFPTWEEHLHEQGRTAHIDSMHIQNLLDDGNYEEVLEEIEAARGKEIFIQEMRDVFSRTGSIPDVVWRISELFNDTLITTNYDHLLEQAYDTGGKSSVQIINGTNTLQQVAPKKTTIIKLHGDIRNPNDCILSKTQYDEAYGKQLEVNKPVPKQLSYYYKNSNLLFLGCSLNKDRTVDVLNKVREEFGEKHEIPQHFSIEQAPEDSEALADRNAYLVKMGITPIWFQKGQYDSIENILRLAKSELNYQAASSHKNHSQVKQERSVNIDVDLNIFLNDFVDLMPLLYCLHRRVPQKSTQKYLQAMQRVFHADSIFIETTENNLVNGLDHLLRAIANQPKFDSYTYQKLSMAFDDFQSYLFSVGADNCLNDKFERNYHECFTTLLRQFEKLVERMDKDGLDYHLIRLLIALLGHGLNQFRSQNDFCELPEIVNIELADYVKVSLSSTLGLRLPDRLNSSSANEINSLCESSWNNFDSDVYEIGFVERVKLFLLKAKLP